MTKRKIVILSVIACVVLVLLSLTIYYAIKISKKKPDDNNDNNDNNQEYTWSSIPDETSKCSVACGDGVKSRKVICVDKVGNIVADNLCDISTKPTNVYDKCNNGPCNEWIVGDWSKCSVPCGPGEMTRDVTCPVDVCIGDKPSTTQECNNGVCDWSKNNYYTNQELLNGKWTYTFNDFPKGVYILNMDTNNGKAELYIDVYSVGKAASIGTIDFSYIPVYINFNMMQTDDDMVVYIKSFVIDNIIDRNTISVKSMFSSNNTSTFPVNGIFTRIVG
jgi:hypothetical protein